MTISMKAINVDMNKVMVLPKGIDLVKFNNQNRADPSKINAIVTRSLTGDYRHNIILKAFDASYGTILITQSAYRLNYLNYV